MADRHRAGHLLDRRPPLGHRGPAFAHRTSAIVEGDSLAYLAEPRQLTQNGERRYELGGTATAPHGAHLADRLTEQIRRWDRNRAAQPVIDAYLAGTADDPRVGGVIIDKRNIRMVVAP